jgi:SPP1 family predicted phage head-tail adaptor
MLQAGRLRERITIRRMTNTPTGKGGSTRAWADVVADLPAEVLGQSGREAVIANTLQGTATYRITIRYREGIQTSDQILWRDQELNILAPPSDPTGRREMMEIFADTSAPQNA